MRLRLLLTASVFIAWSPARSAEERPPDEAFDRSAFDLGFQIPESFKLAGSNRKYLPTQAGKAPCLDLTWKRNSDSIMIRLMVVPDVAWQKPPSEMFADARKSMLASPNLKVISERSYQVGGHPAYSYIISFQLDKPMFYRMDCVLNKPDLHVVTYISPNEEALKGEASKALFQSISIRPKKQNSR